MGCSINCNIFTFLKIVADLINFEGKLNIVVKFDIDYTFRDYILYSYQQ